GATPFVDAARILALAGGFDEVRTEARLSRAAPALGIPPGEVQAWLRAFYAIQRERLRHQAACLDMGRSADNRIDPRTLNAFDRQVLKLAFAQARRLQHRLALDYGL